MAVNLSRRMDKKSAAAVQQTRKMLLRASVAITLGKKHSKRDVTAKPQRKKHSKKVAAVMGQQNTRRRAEKRKPPVAVERPFLLQWIKKKRTVAPMQFLSCKIIKAVVAERHCLLL